MNPLFFRDCCMVSASWTARLQIKAFEMASQAPGPRINKKCHTAEVEIHTVKKYKNRGGASVNTTSTSFQEQSNNIGKTQVNSTFRCERLVTWDEAQFCISDMLLCEDNSLPEAVHEMVYNRTGLVWIQAERAMTSPNKKLKIMSFLELEFRNSSADAILRTVKIEAEDEEELCVICCENYSVGEEVAQMHCSHKFHIHCIVRWLEESRFCPICRHEIQTV